MKSYCDGACRGGKPRANSGAVTELPYVVKTRLAPKAHILSRRIMKKPMLKVLLPMGALSLLVGALCAYASHDVTQLWSGIGVFTLCAATAWMEHIIES